MKFAAALLLWCPSVTCLGCGRTIGGHVEHNEACVNRSGAIVVRPCRCIGVAAQPMVLLEQVDFMAAIAERPESAEARNAAAYDGYALSLHVVCGTVCGTILQLKTSVSRT